MKIPIRFIIFVAKTVSWMSRMVNLGSGATWPGEVALRLNPHILTSLATQIKKGVILIAGTNGKTTTALMVKTILEAQGLKVVYNASGANLENGIVSACIKKSSWNSKLTADYGVFEVDENSLPAVLKEFHSVLRAGIHYSKTGSRVKPGMTASMIIVLLNLFRDQLDRYGEVDVIAEKWQRVLRVQHEQGQEGQEDSKISKNNTFQIIANADDPLVVEIATSSTARNDIVFFGINDKTKYQKTMDHATDSIYCTHCGARLAYEGVYFSHLGIWACPKCGQKRPTPDISGGKSPLPGLYNLYNTLAAMSVAKTLGIQAALEGFHPAFGRQEEIGNAKIFLSKNPTGFNQSLRTVLDLGAKHLLFVLNDRIPDGRDISWIWDVDFEIIPKDVEVRVSGDRVYDLALRLKYAGIKVSIFKRIEEALETKDTMYVLPTYSAMLDVRKILKGRKIL